MFLPWISRNVPRLLWGKQMDPKNGSKKSEPVMYHVDVGKGQIWKWHLDQLRYRFGEVHQPAISSTGPTDSTIGDDVYCLFEQDAPPPEQGAPNPSPGMDPAPPVRERTYSQREHYPPECYGRPICC